MTQHVVRYTIKPDQVAHNEELVRAVFEELDRVQPPGLRYAAFKLDDGVSFLHLVCSDSKPPQLQTLKAFHAGLRERCADAPVRTALAEIGSFGLFSDA